MIRLNIPFRSQWAADANLHSGDCGPTCLAMILNYYRIDMTPNGVYRLWTPNKPYWAIWELIKAGEAKKIKLARQKFEDRFVALRNLYQFLDAGRPVIALIKYKPWRELTGNQFSGGHYVVVTGYENGQITVNDPLFGAWVKPGELGAHYTHSVNGFCAAWEGFEVIENPNLVCLVVEDTNGAVAIDPPFVAVPEPAPEPERPPTPEAQPEAEATAQPPVQPAAESAEPELEETTLPQETPEPVEVQETAEPGPEGTPPPQETPEPLDVQETAAAADELEPVQPLAVSEPQAEVVPEPETEIVDIAEERPNRMDDINKRVRALAAFRWAEAPDPNDAAEMQLWLDHLGDWGLYYDEYVVRPGDSFTLIAGRIYDSQRRWHGIEEYNDLANQRLFAGVTLLIPQLGEDGTWDSRDLPKDTAPYTKDLDMILRSEEEAEDYDAIFGPESMGIGF